MRELGERKRRVRGIVPVLVLVALALLALVTLRTGGLPEVEVTSDLPGIGPLTRVTSVATEPGRGVARMTVELVQGERSRVLADENYETRAPWAFWGPREAAAAIDVEIGSTVTEGLAQGPATVRATAWRAGTWLRSPAPVSAEIELPVRLRPPSVALLSSQHYPTQGGAEAVVYRVGDEARRHGVSAGDAFFPGYPLPGGTAGETFALFAVPFDLPLDSPIRLVVEDDVGYRTERAFVDRLRPREVTHDDINVPDSFIERVASEIESQTPSLTATGSLLDRYLAINRDLRVENRAEIGALAGRSEERFAWRGAFLPMPNGQVMARFGDRRTYRYGGEEVDRQVHLGYDLASVRRAEVPAANAGTVVAARFLGIYGNVVVIDHGYGLLSLYGHLSSIDVSEGEAIERGRTVGRTGVTGLAGGDHLHFGMFLHGVAVDPVEWLDADWIENRIASKLSPAFERGR